MATIYSSLIEYPERSLGHPSQLARVGDTLYAIDAAHRLFVFDVRDPSAPRQVRAISLPGAPLWIGAADARLTLILKGLSEDPDLVERESVTHLASYSIATPEEPVWMGSVQLAGELRVARQEETRLVTLSTVRDTPQCQPEPGSMLSAESADEMVVTELRSTDDGLAVTEQLAVAGEGYIETDSAFVITKQGVMLTGEGTLTVVAVGDGSSGLARYGPVDLLEARLLAHAPMAFVDDNLAFFTTDGNNLSLNVVELSANGASQWRSLQLASSGSSTESLSASACAGRFALVADPALRGPGLLVDLFAEAGPAVVGNLPEQVQAVVPLGLGWLGINPESSLVVAFTLNESGQLSVTSEATFASQISGQSGPPAVAWDEARERVLVPHSQSSVSNTDYYLGELSLTSGALAWTEGPRLTGSAVLPGLSGGPDRLAIEPGDDVTFAVTGFRADPFASDRTILEAVDFAATTSNAVSLANHFPAVALTDTFQARLFADLDRTRKIAFRALGKAEDTQVFELLHHADSLCTLNGTMLAYSLTHPVSCYAEGPDGSSVEVDCPPDERPTISVFALEGGPERTSVIPLPEVAAPERTDIQVGWHWLGLVAQADQVGLLLQRETLCESAAACEELGVQTTVDDELGAAGAASTEQDPTGAGGAPATSGWRYEVWLYPLDLARAQFEQPKQLGELDQDRYFTAEGFVDNKGFSLLDVHPVDESLNRTFARARLELLVFDQVTAATPPERVTIRGQPMAVRGSTVITIEPAGLPEATASVRANVHRLRIQGNRATVEQTLDIGTGYEGHAWGDERGYILLKPDDRCAEPRSCEVVSLGLQDDTLIETGRVVVPGISWAISRASDEVLLLSRSIDRLTQYAIYDVTDTGLALRGVVPVPYAGLPSYPYLEPVAVSGSQVLIGAELVGGPDE